MARRQHGGRRNHEKDRPAVRKPLDTATLHGRASTVLPGGTPKGVYSTLKDALGSGQALRAYAELSLVAALMDRYFMSSEDLRKVLGSINGLAQRTDVNLKRFRDLTDWAGDHSRSSDFWFSTLL